MNTVKLSQHRKIFLDNEDIPKINPDEVLLKIKSVGICASDVHYYRDGKIGPTHIEKPIIPGHEFSGEIIRTGKKVKNLTPGTKVAADPALPCDICEFCREGNPNLCPEVKFCGTPPTQGALQEYMAYPAHLLFPLPDKISYEEGAILETLGVSLHSVDLSKIRIGQTAAVLGSGSIGLLVIQLLRYAGVKTIFATDLLDYRLEMAKKMGADFTFNPEKEDIAGNILSLTENRGVDAAFEAAGSLDTPQQCIDSVKPGGKIIIIGICPEDKISIKSTNARRKGVTIKLVRRMKNTYPRTISLVENNDIDLNSIITHKFKLEEAEKAFRTVAAYDDNIIKAVISM